MPLQENCAATIYREVGKFASALTQLDAHSSSRRSAFHPFAPVWGSDLHHLGLHLLFDRSRGAYPAFNCHPLPGRRPHRSAFPKPGWYRRCWLSRVSVGISYSHIRLRRMGELGRVGSRSKKSASRYPDYRFCLDPHCRITGLAHLGLFRARPACSIQLLWLDFSRPRRNKRCLGYLCPGRSTKGNHLSRYYDSRRVEVNACVEMAVGGGAPTRHFDTRIDFLDLLLLSNSYCIILLCRMIRLQQLAHRRVLVASVWSV